MTKYQVEVGREMMRRCVSRDMNPVLVRNRGLQTSARGVIPNRARECGGARVLVCITTITDLRIGRQAGGQLPLGAAGSETAPEQNVQYARLRDNRGQI